MKRQVSELLRQDDLDAALRAMGGWPSRQVINPLFGLLYSGDERLRWHAVTAIGVVTARLADQELEAARVIMRRLMWNLNDESGGMGWGSPQAMGEIMACHAALAEEYASILISYLDPQGNFLEHEGLQQSVLWGFGRLAHARPVLTQDGAVFLRPFLNASNALLRGLAVWAAAAVIDSALKDLIRTLCSDPAMITVYFDRRLMQVTIADLAQAAMAREIVARNP